VRFYKSVLQPVLNYAAVRRTDTAKREEILVTKMNTLRKITGKRESSMKEANKGRGEKMQTRMKQLHIKNNT
jgi:hypothetical protein